VSVWQNKKTNLFFSREMAEMDSWLRVLH